MRRFPLISFEEINAAIGPNDPRELSLLVLSVALHETESNFAESICIQFAEHEDFNVRGNAILGFSHIARILRRLNKENIVPLVNAALLDKHEWVRGQAQDVKGDLRHFLGWKFEDQ